MSYSTYTFPFFLSSKDLKCTHYIGKLMVGGRIGCSTEGLSTLNCPPHISGTDYTLKLHVCALPFLLFFSFLCSFLEGRHGAVPGNVSVNMDVS